MRYIKGWPATRKRIYRQQDGICYWCGKPVAWDDYDLDHRLERVMGGGNEDSNLVVSHKRCNRKRSTHVTRKRAPLPHAAPSRWS